MAESSYTNSASPQIESLAKSESSLTFTIGSEKVQCLAHFIPATRQVLDDFTQLQSYLDVRLIEGLRDKEDQQLLTGSGTNQDLNGLTLQARGI